MKKYNLNTVKDFENFIKNFNIKSRNELNKRFYTVYKKFLTLDEDIKDKLLPSLVISTELNNLEDYSKFIKEHGILTRTQLYKSFPNVYRRFERDLSKEDLDKILPKQKTEYSEDMYTFEYLEKYIKNNNIKSRTEFSSFCDVLYRRFLELSEEEQDKLLPFSKFHNINDFKSFQKFIKDNNVTSRKDLSDRFGRLCVKFQEILTQEEKEKLLPSNREDLSSLTNYYGFSEFIAKNNILSRRDFQKRSTAGYHRFKTYLNKEEQDSLLPIRRLSVGELFLIKIFNKVGFKYQTQKIFQDLLGKNKMPLRYDFYLPEYNVLIEYHGCQHFDPNNSFYREDAILRDRVKYEYAESRNISIFYFTNEIEIYKKFGYFTEVITDSDILIKKIKEIGLTNQLNS